MSKQFILNDSQQIRVLEKTEVGGVKINDVPSLSAANIPLHLKTAIVAELNVAYNSGVLKGLTTAKGKVDDIIKATRTI
jgi:hypothetical protein